MQNLTVKNVITGLLTMLVFSIIFVSCAKDEVQKTATTTTTEQVFNELNTDVALQAFTENVAVTKFNQLVLGEDKFAYELTFVDFSNGNNLPEGLGFQGLTLLDNGKENDRVAHDGIYTSVETASIREFGDKGAGFQPIYDNAFQYSAQFEGARSIGCTFRPCGCPCPGGASCPACDWWGYSCWEVVECEISIF